MTIENLNEEKKYLSRDINWWINFLTDQQPEVVKEGLSNTAKIYIYLRDNLNVKTVGDAEKILKERNVDIDIVNDWIEEGLVRDELIIYAIVNGYPELKNKLQKKLSEENININFESKEKYQW